MWHEQPDVGSWLAWLLFADPWPAWQQAIGDAVCWGMFLFAVIYRVIKPVRRDRDRVGKI